MLSPSATALPRRVERVLCSILSESAKQSLAYFLLQDQQTNTCPQPYSSLHEHFSCLERIAHKEQQR
ncbi:hypothetical protein E2C01_035963 [Portunus trituberculatus]|uniref:Uncharacterized protein n=1 Tax=Portunus trituberculatus TaxID=210409 RepID=A0A5B7FB53_PORTR|nr:hypothetical protein [Portunus trituberculatus]